MPPPTAAQSGKDSAWGPPGPLALGPPPIETAENVCVCAQYGVNPSNTSYRQLPAEGKTTLAS
jgi:hypothetical protein